MYLRLPIIAGLLSMAISGGVFADLPAAESRRTGLTLHVYDVGPLRQLQRLVTNQTPNVSRYIDTFDLSSKEDFGLDQQFIAEAKGFLIVAEAGVYSFELLSDDGSELLIDGRQVVEHDGLHDEKSTKTADVRLDVGVHEIEARMFENGGDQRLRVRWKTPGASDYALIPSASLFTEANVVHVTSPGRKNLIAPLSNSRPGDAQPLVLVHPSFTVSTLHHEGFEPKIGGIDFLRDGRLVVCTWDPRGDVFIVDPDSGASRRFATGLAEPLGVKVVDDDIYVLQKQELTQLLDNDNDGVADEYRCISADWPVTANFHEFAFGLVYKDGWFYANLAVAINPGGRTTNPQISHDSQTQVGRGQIIRIERSTGRVETVAQGLRTPNGIGTASDGAIYLTDNQGDWLPSSKLLKFKPGAFYGSHTTPNHSFADRPVTPPIAWLPQGEIGNSPSQPVECRVGPWKGQILHGDVTHGGIKRTFVEAISTPAGLVEQGCVFRFSQGFNGGVNRLAWGPDDALYVGQIGGPGNWGQQDKKWFGLQKLQFNSTTIFEMLAVRAKSNGMEIEFTTPLADGLGDEPTHYTLRQWRYEPADSYGGPKVDEEPLVVKSASVSNDRKRVFLEIDGLNAGHVVYLRLADLLRSETEEKLWSTEAWYTLNAIPKDAPGDVQPRPQQNVLTAAEETDGWRLLFNGNDLSQWHTYQQPGKTDGWQAVDGELRRVGPGGDLCSNDSYADFEFSYEWKVSEAGNSGVYYRVDEGESPGWRTGVEMQVLDNQRHPDGRDALTSAGSVYGMVAPLRDASLGADRWNVARIEARGSRVTHWLNNEPVATYDTATQEWKSLVAQSKFKDMPRYGTLPDGKICLQDHGDVIAYRNLKIRELK